MEGLVDQDLFDDEMATCRVERTYSVDVTPDYKDFPKLLEEPLERAVEGSHLLNTVDYKQILSKLVGPPEVREQ